MLVVLASALLSAAGPAPAQPINILEKLDAQVPLDAKLTTGDGVETTLGKLLEGGKPTILTLGYYECPMLCDMVLNGVLTGVKGLSFNAGNEYQVVSVSIEPKETYELARDKQANYLKSYGRENLAPNAWRFTAAAASESKRIADAVGWQYFWDDETKQWAHAAGVFVLTPQGHVSRVLYGIEFNPRDLKFALIEAGEGRVGSALEKLVLWCYHYDPQERGYVVFAMRVMRVGGLLTMLILGMFVFTLVRADRRRQMEKQWTQ